MQGNACGDATYSYKLGTKSEVVETTINLPPATISGSLQNCSLNNGWCNTASELSLNGKEPLSGYNILAIEGSLNGQTFACSGSACNVPLNEGNNDLSFWALSSYGDSSTMGTTSVKVDTVSPSVGLDLSGSSGTNGWYISPTTVTATGSDATSGLLSALLSENGGPWESSSILSEGVHNISVQAEDNAGNTANSSTLVSVDTTTPTIDVSVNGITGNNGWYSSSMQVSATAYDATSGVNTLEVTTDGGQWTVVNSPVSFADGYHTVQFKATDKAGNETETSVQEFYVDTIAPAIDLPAEWEVKDTITYKIQDDGSELSALRIVIEDEDEKFAKVAWDEVVSGNKFKGEITWNGKFKDGTVAPPGEYLVWVKVTDVAGNERIALGRVIVPQPFASFSLIQPSKSSAEIPTPPADLFDSKDSSPLPENPNPNPSTSPNTSFGGSTAQTSSTTVQSLTLTSGSSSASSTTPSNVLWGATAAALIGWATATALEEKKKRKALHRAGRDEQEQAQISEVSLQMEKTKARASQDEEPPMTRQDAQARKQRKELQKLWDANGTAIYEANRDYKAKHGKEMDAAARSKAIKDATRNGVFNTGAYASNLEAEKTRRDAQNEHMANKMTRFEKEEEVRWQASQKAAEEKQKAEELQAGYAAYYAAMRQGDQEAKSNWWEQTKSFVQEKIVQPVNLSVYQPVIKPMATSLSNSISDGIASFNQNFYQPVVKPTIESAKEAISNGIMYLDNTVYKPLIQPAIKRDIERIKIGSAWVNEHVYQPIIKPRIEQEIEKFKTKVELVNDKVYQPIIKPMLQNGVEKLKTAVELVDKHVYQPWIQPMVSAVNENFIQPYVVPMLDKAKGDMEQGFSWFDENIYQPVFAPVVNDVNKYIYQPLANKAQATWNKYGEWVHGTLDAAGLIPGFGEIADGLNGLIYLGEGRYLEAGISAMAMIPILGDLGKAGKWTIKIGSEVVEVIAETAVKTAMKEIAENAAQEAVEKVVKETLEEGVERVGKETLENVAEKAAMNALEQSAKELAQVALAKTATDMGKVPVNIVEDVMKKSQKEFISSPAAKQVAEDAAENTAKKVDTLQKFSGQTIEGSNCYKFGMETAQETIGNAPIKAPRNPWGDSYDSVMQFIENGNDEVLEALQKNAKPITRNELEVGDLVSWHGIKKLNFGYGHGPDSYMYTQHVGVFAGGDQIVSQMGKNGVVEIMDIDNPILKMFIENGHVLYWRL